jgi:hypothetical protein
MGDLIEQRVADLASYPDLVVIYPRNAVYRLRGLLTALRLRSEV